MPGWTQILLVLVIILVLFGGKKLPDLAHSLGKSLGEFKKGRAEAEKELDDVVNSDAKSGAPKAAEDADAPAPKT